MRFLYEYYWFSDNAGEVVRLHSNMTETSLILLTARNELFILDICKKVIFFFLMFIVRACYKSKRILKLSFTI